MAPDSMGFICSGGSGGLREAGLQAGVNHGGHHLPTSGHQTKETEHSYGDVSL